MFALLIRTLILYFTLVITLRLTGKRQVGEMQVSELITAFLISETAATPLADPDMPLLTGIVPVLALISVEIILSFAVEKLPFIRRMLVPPPTALVANGKINLHAMEKQRVTMEELTCALRLKDIADPCRVSFCFLEHNGQISAFTEEDRLMLPVISEGKINIHMLNLIGRDRKWLSDRLTEIRCRPPDLLIFATDGRKISYRKR